MGATQAKFCIPADLTKAWNAANGGKKGGHDSLIWNVDGYKFTGALLTQNTKKAFTKISKCMRKNIEQCGKDNECDSVMVGSGNKAIQEVFGLSDINDKILTTKPLQDDKMMEILYKEIKRSRQQFLTVRRNKRRVSMNEQFLCGKLFDPFRIYRKDSSYGLKELRPLRGFEKSQTGFVRANHCKALLRDAKVLRNRFQKYFEREAMTGKEWSRFQQQMNRIEELINTTIKTEKNKYRRKKLSGRSVVLKQNKEETKNKNTWSTTIVGAERKRNNNRGPKKERKNTRRSKKERKNKRRSKKKTTTDAQKTDDNTFVGGFY